MLNLLIVDDQKEERAGIRDILAWEQLGIIVSGEASNGMEGLEKALELKTGYHHNRYCDAFNGWAQNDAGNTKTSTADQVYFY